MGPVRVRGSCGESLRSNAVHRDAFARRGQGGWGARRRGCLALDPSGALHPGLGAEPGGGGPAGADLSSLTPLPFAHGQAMASGDMTEPDAKYALGRKPPQRPQAGCSRGSRPRMLVCRLLRGRVLRPQPRRSPWTGDACTRGEPAPTPAAEFVAELAETLEEMGIRPEQFHAEVGQGNLEPPGGDRPPGGRGQAGDGARGDPGPSLLVWTSRPRWPRSPTWRGRKRPPPPP